MKRERILGLQAEENVNVDKPNEKAARQAEAISRLHGKPTDPCTNDELRLIAEGCDEERAVRDAIERLKQ